MGNIRNKIITLSGEPASGKSTVVRKLKEKYEKMGYNVHVVSTGNIFREIISREYYKMYPNRSGVSLADMQSDVEFAKQRNEIDQMIDGEMEERGRRINSIPRKNDVYIIDSRLAWKNIPDSFAIRLSVDEKVAGERTFLDKTRGEEDKYQTLEEAIIKTRQRKMGEIERYKQRYGVDLTDPENYSLLVNTTHSYTDELADIIIQGEECHRTGKYFPKYWKSPALFFPTQSIRETISKSPLGGNALEDVVESIKKYGYNYNEPLIAKEVNGITALQDGHHRCIATVSAGKTLVPYEIMPKTNNQCTESTICSEVKLSDIYDWEEMIRYEAKRANVEILKQFDVSKLNIMDKYVKWLKSANER